MKNLVISLFILLFSNSVVAQDECVPPEGGRCLTKEQFEAVKRGLTELDMIHSSPAVLSTSDEIVIIHDWEGRVYTNSGSSNPMTFKLKLGETVERDMAVTLPTKLYYRPKPPDPMFRLRIRAQVGLLIPELVQTISGKKQSFWDGSLGLDFFHYKMLNFAVWTGVRSVGAGVGFDITKNFGPYLGYALRYDGFKSSVTLGTYMSFN